MRTSLLGCPETRNLRHLLSRSVERFRRPRFRRRVLPENASVTLQSLFPAWGDRSKTELDDSRRAGEFPVRSKSVTEAVTVLIRQRCKRETVTYRVVRCVISEPRVHTDGAFREPPLSRRRTVNATPPKPRRYALWDTTYSVSTSSRLLSRGVGEYRRFSERRRTTVGEDHRLDGVVVETPEFELLPTTVLRTPSRKSKVVDGLESGRNHWFLHSRVEDSSG